MRVPNYPSNQKPTNERRPLRSKVPRMKPSRETCHMTLLVRVFLICISHVNPVWPAGFIENLFMIFTHYQKRLFQNDPKKRFRNCCPCCLRRLPSCL